MSNKKDAANISVNLGTQLINAALTLMALSGAFLTFILDKKTPTISFYILYGLAFLCFLASIFMGGRGVDDIRFNGANGDWETHGTGKTNWFDYQSLCLLAGIICIGILPFLGNSKSEEAENKKYFELLHQRDSILTVQLKNICDRPARKDTIYIATPVCRPKPADCRHRRKRLPCQTQQQSDLKK